MMQRAIPLLLVCAFMASCKEDDHSSSGGGGSAILRVINHEFSAATVTINGVVRGQVPAYATQDFTIPTGSGSWRLSWSTGSAGGGYSGVSSGEVAIAETPMFVIGVPVPVFPVGP